jgi:UDP-2,4-diacetamido-2,4,6-trideoxy-beta-L-altropyranose hydrolase
MRCLALAEALRDGGDEVLLLTRPEAGPALERWRDLDVPIQLLDEPPGSTGDADVTTRAVRARDARWLVLDGYCFDARYRSAVREAARLAVIDDHGEDALEADLVVNANLYATHGLYPRTRAHVLTGPRYAMLRREFRRHQEPVPRSGVLVSLGGADPSGRTAALIEELARRGVDGRVVVGPKYPSAETLARVAAASGWKTVTNPSSMNGLLRSCEVAAIGSGTTTAEGLATGTPMVAVVIADNQVAVAAELSRRGLAATVPGSNPAEVASLVVDLLADPQRRRAMVGRGRSLVDGRGAIRVADAMRTLAPRPAEVESQSRRR